MFSWYINFWKPLAGFAAAVCLFLLLWPVMVVAALALAVGNQGKIFFIQERVGRGERTFKLLKFRTLLEPVPGASIQTDHDRQFPLGTFLRRYHIDELPQLINVLKGDLSLIGPRPLLKEYLPYYTENQRSRHYIRPGMTGLSQALGGNSLNWQQRLRLDAFYVKNCTPGLDLRIIWLTIKYLLVRHEKAQDESLFSVSLIDYLEKGARSHL